MTDTPESGAMPRIAIPDLDSVIERYEERQRRRAALRPANKKALFAVLDSVGVTSVTVRFDGYGDSGQIEEIDARNAEGATGLPEVGVTIMVARYGEDEPEQRCLTLGQAIEELAYEALGELHDGWENNDGAFGEFVFDTAKRSITLDYSERYTATEHYSHEL
jgi:hypothetical protein